MKLRIIAIVCFLCVALTSQLQAQFTIPTIEPSQVGTAPMADTLRRGALTNDYFSLAKWKAEKKAIRKERNTIEFNSMLTASQTQFVNWQAGGDNTFTARTTMLFHHLYKREKFSLDYRFDARYGMNYIENKMFKNEDEFKINIQTSWKMHKSWSYAATFNLRSQFSEGHKSRTDETTISSFMAPGYVDIAVGFVYKKDGSPWNITISPIAGSITTVLDEELRKNGVGGKGIAGVPLGDLSKGQMGPSVRIFFDKQFAKEVLRYRFNFYSFTNLKTVPTVRWENNLEIKATKVLSTTLYGLLYYDKYSGTVNPQYNYSLGLTLSYSIKNK